MRKTNTNIVTRKDLIKKIHEDFDGEYSKREITRILDSLEFFIYDNLIQATESHGVQIRLFGGLQLISTYVPEKVCNTCFGDNITIPARIKTKAKLTRYYNQKLNEDWKDEK